MKTFKNFQSESVGVLNKVRKFGGAALSAAGLTGMVMQAKRKDVTKKEYDKLQQKYNDEYFNSPQINPPEFDRVKNEYDKVKKENGKKNKS